MSCAEWGIVRAGADLGMKQQKVDDRLNSGLNAARPTWRMSGDVVKDRAEIGERGKRVAEFHNPCLAQTARTCSSVANSDLGRGFP